VYGDAVKNDISNLFTMELMKRVYVCHPNQGRRSLLKEQDFQASDLTTTWGLPRQARSSNVPAVMLIEIPKYKGRRWRCRPS